MFTVCNVILDMMRLILWFLCEGVYIKTKADKIEGKQKETQIDYGMLLFLYKGRLWRAPAVYWFSELLYSHCYPRVPSTVHWTHAAPQAAIPVWEAPALTTGPSQITHQRRIHTLSSLNSFRWGQSGPTLGNEAHSYIFKIFFVCGVVWCGGWGILLLYKWEN